jgi:hypothetical protein
MILGTPVCRECFMAVHQQTVSHSVFAERCFRTRSIGQGIHRFLLIIVVDEGDLKIYNVQITSIQRKYKSHSFNVHLIIILVHFTRKSAAL